VSHQEAAEEGLAYLNRAEKAAPITSAFYQIRARLLKGAGKQAEAQRDEDLARRTPATIPLDHYLLAGAAYDGRDMAEAVRQYEAALRVEPTHYWSLLGLGSCLSTPDQPEQDFASAAAVFTGCILRRPDYAHPYVGRGHAYGRLKRYAEAEADFRQALRLRADYPEAHANLGWVLKEQGKHAEVEAEYREAIRLRPGDPRGHYSFGLALYGQGKHAEAEREFREAGRLRPDDFFAHHWVAITMSAQGKYAAAAHYYVEQSAADPKFADSLEFLNRNNAAGHAALAGCGQGDGAKLDDAQRARLRQQALDWMRTNLAGWREQLDKDPKKYCAFWQRKKREFGRLLPYDPDFDGVRGDALAKLPETEQKAWQQLWADVDQVFASVKSPYGAWSPAELKRRVDDLSKLLQSNPRDAGLLEQRAGLYAYLGRYDEAALDFIRANELLASRWGWDATSALFESLMQHEQVFARVAELRPDDVALRSQRGNYYALRGQWERALPDYARASQEQGWYYSHACVLLLTGDEEGYRRVCRRMAAQLGETDQPHTAARLVGTCSAGPQSRIDPARIAQWADLAISSGRNKFTLEILAHARYRAGQLDQAVSLLQEAMDLPKGMMPKSAAAFPLALAHHGLGQEEESRKWYQIGVAELENITPRERDIPVSWACPHWLIVNVWYREAKTVFEPGEPQGPKTEEPE
jgi:tetratricopeptide (TPR) repeat protein